MLTSTRLSSALRRFIVLALAAGYALSLSINVVQAQSPISSNTFVGQIPAAKSVAKSIKDLASAPSPKGTPTIPEGAQGPALLPPQARPPVFDPVLQVGGSALPGNTPDVGIDQLGDPDQYAGHNFIEGINSGSEPPDTVMDVGPNHVVQMTNGTTWQVWDKNGNALTPTLNFANLWPAGDPCNSNLGDVIVVYDHLADRWLLSQFARNAAQTQFWMCIAISQTPNPVPSPTNQYWLYTIEVPNFPDYPKFGVWPDAYYMSDYEAGNLGVFAFDRASMLTGAATRYVRTTTSALTGSRRDTRILPADLDGPSPPDGTPGFFFRPVDDAQDNANPTDRLEVFEFHVDWNNPAGATFTLADTLTPAAFETFDCNRAGSGIRDCIPQPTTNRTIDALSNRPMMQLKFRNFSGDFRMVVNQTVDISGNLPNTLNIPNPGEVAGVRWYELQKTGAHWTIRQQGTYAPQPNGATTEAQLLHRWMGSTAMDKFGNIAIGYSIVNSDNNNPVFPGIRYTGRAAGDVLNSMPQGEKSIFEGTTWHRGLIDPNTGDWTRRWGDYSAMTVDPTDDCTFWYTTHLSDSEPSSRTKIASFRFSGCGTDLAITKTASPDSATAGESLTYTITVTNNGPQDATNVVVTDTLPNDVIYQANTDSCSVAGQTLTCNLGSINDGQKKSFEVSVKVNSSVTAPLTNQASVRAAQTELNNADNTISVTTLVKTAADLQVSKQCKPDSAGSAGGKATCTILVDNLGPSDATNVVVTDKHLSNGNFAITSATFTPPGANCGISDGVVTCNLGIKPIGGRTTITVEITSNDPVDVNDTATVQSNTTDPNTANNSATGKVSFQGTADLVITKTASSGSVVAGANLTYTLLVNNNGPSQAANVVVEDVLPTQVSVVSAAPSQGACSGTTNPGQQPLTCNLGVLTNGGSATILVVVKVNQDISKGTILVNNATVRSDYFDPNNGNNNATASTTVTTSADLAITKTADKAVYKPSSLVIYTVAVVNNGSSDARQVVVTDNLPDLKQAIYQSDNGGCAKDATIPTKLTCNVGYLPVGERRSFQIYLVIKGSRGDVANTATVASPDSDPVSSNNTATRIVTIGK